MCLRTVPYICDTFSQRIIRTGQRVTKAALVAHADDIMIFEKASADIQLSGDLLLNYERAKGARLNIRKSKATAASSWDKSRNMHPILSGNNHTGFQIQEYSRPLQGMSLCRRRQGRSKPW
jgi:hypothetical protein